MAPPDMSQQNLGVLLHDSTGEHISLVWPQVMSLSPSSTNQLLEVLTRIKLFIIGGEVV